MTRVLRSTTALSLCLKGGTLAALAMIAACAATEPEPPPPPPPPSPPPPALALNQGVSEAASIYVAFIREVGTIEAGFPDAESIQNAIRTGSAYEPAQLSRGMIAYGAVLALQSPEFVAGVRQYAADPVQREEIINRIIQDPAYAATLPGADAAAGLIVSTLGEDIAALSTIAEAIKEDAYTIQGRADPRRRWATRPMDDRQGRLDAAKANSVVVMLPSAEDASLLFTAAHAGSGLELAPIKLQPPYTQPVINSLAIAALAALGAGGDDFRTYTEALVVETNNEFCLNMSKLNLFQCLAASRPHYEDIFCIGQHIVSDLATCAAQSMGPMPVMIPTTAFALDEGTLTGAPAATAAAAADSAQSQAPSPGRP